MLHVRPRTHDAATPHDSEGDLVIQILAQSSGSSGSALGLLLPLLLMGGVFYFLLIRPNRNRQRQQQSLVDSIRVGDEVMTMGGMFGTVKEIDEENETVLLEIAPGTDVRMMRKAIAQRLTEDEGEDEGAEGSDDEEAGSTP
jgi:preprotein translocase subunit YajC